MSATEIGGNTTNILNCYFSKQVYTLAHQTKSLRMVTEIFFLKTVFFWSSREMQRRLRQTKVYYELFYWVSKEVSQKLLKVAAAKKFFPSLFIIDRTSFDECFLFYVITASSIFTQIYRYPEAYCNRHVAAFFETNVLKEVRILCPLSPQ